MTNQENDILKSSKESIAIHESGHAIMAYLMGYRIIKIHVFPHKVFGYNGYMEDDSNDNPSSIEEAKKSICVCYAGEIAENIKYGFGVTRQSGRGLLDRGKASKLLEKHFMESKNEHMELLKEKVKSLLENNWSSVEELSKILIQGEKECVLQGDEVLRIIINNK